MKIGLLTNVFFPVTNGVVHSIHLLAKGLKKFNRDVNVISSKHPNFSQDLVKKYQIDYNLIKISSVYFPAFDYCIPNPFVLKKELNKINFKFDIIQINHPFIIYKISKILKKLNPLSKVIFVYHTQYDQYHHYVRFIPKFIYEKFLNKHLTEIFEFVNLIIFPSKSIMKSIKEKFRKYSDKFVFISNPVDLEHLRKINENMVFELKKKYNLEEKFILGFVGRIEKEKNLHSLLELFKEILEFFGNDKRDNLRLLIVGDGSQLNNLIKFATDLGIRDYVVFTGKVNYSDIQNYYGLMDVFVTLSLSEVKPLSYLESLAVGVPIISFNTFGADDLINHKYNGFLINIDDKNYRKDFIRIIYELYENKELLRKLKRNALESSKEYDYLKISEKYLQVYQSL